MPLVEIIVGEQTSDEALAKAYDVVRQIKKTPIVVNDSRGFFTSRVFGTLVLEGAAMLGEGIDPVDDRARRDPDGLPGAAARDGRRGQRSCSRRRSRLRRPRRPRQPAPARSPSPAMAVVDRMVDEFDRQGKAAGAGFYDYPAGDGRRSSCGRACGSTSSTRRRTRSSDDVFHDLQERFTFVMSLETIKCVDEGVLRSTADANIGSIFGIGFPPLYGGALQYVNNYQGRDGTENGVPGFLARARELAAAYGAAVRATALLCRRPRPASGSSQSSRMARTA